MRHTATAGGTLDYTYNSDGLRATQGADTFNWDWASGVPELLSDGESVYLVGDDTASPRGAVGWQTGTDWIYTILDALGSVRQETDTTGVVFNVREWSPYGKELVGAHTIARSDFERVAGAESWKPVFSILTVHHHAREGVTFQRLPFHLCIS